MKANQGQSNHRESREWRTERNKDGTQPKIFTSLHTGEKPSEFQEIQPKSNHLPLVKFWRSSAVPEARMTVAGRPVRAANAATGS
ncbi:MAG TPA: hypothetical protein VHH73_07195, partial [Verrucomicrobiae bacterium]|nr:hypothetical protein [Verrucomicrobiae bacterium]